MLNVGLTGGIGSGKSTVASLFEELGIPVYNADIRAKALMHSETVMQKVTELLGEEAYQNGELNRQYVASKVFKNEELLHALNKIVHPEVRRDFVQWCESQKSPYLIREAAILFESGAAEQCDMIVTVSVPERIRIQRVIERDGITEEQVKDRISKQWTDQQREEKSDFVIQNIERESLKSQVEEIHESILKQIDQ